MLRRPERQESPGWPEGDFFKFLLQAINSFMDITWPWPGGRGEMMFQDIHLSSILHFPVKEGGSR